MLTVIAEKKNITSTHILIDSKTEYNHVINVHRCSCGDNLRIIDGTFEYMTCIEKIEKKQLFTRILEKIEDHYSLSKNIDIAFGILKNDKMTILLQKLTEIGIRNIIPLQTERVVVKLTESKDKWNTIVREALKQCQGVTFPIIYPITRFQMIDFSVYDKVLFAYENSLSSQSISEIVSKNDKNILYIIGPEGGLSEKEVEYLKENKAIEVCLGKRILRAETAAIVMGGILAHVNT